MARSLFFTGPAASSHERQLSFIWRGLLLALLFAGVPAFAAATSTSLSITSGGSVVRSIASGGVVTLTATVSSGTGAVTVGQVNFCDATATYCTDIHILGTAELTSAGTAMLTFTPGIGNHSYKAVFIETTSNAGSSSSASALVVTGLYPTVTTIAQSGSVGNYTLTATVSGSGPSAPTGTVSFVDTSDGNRVIGTAELANGQQGPGFANVSTPATGVGASSVVVADFNGDGKLDVVSLNASGMATATMTLLLGNGDGTFTAGPTPTVSFSPGVVAVGDFNGDGKPDLAVSSATESTFAVLLGKGDGTFTAAASMPTGSPNGSLTSIFAGDFNGDGKLDLAAWGAQTESGVFASVIVDLGNGDGTFTPAPSYFEVGRADNMIVGDFNGDGRSDLFILSAETFDGEVLLGNSDGTFTGASGFQLTYPSAVAVGDFNGDGTQDLAVGTLTGNTSVSLFLGNGDGTFTPGAVIDLPAGHTNSSIVTEDFNHDGKPDLAILQDGTVDVLEGNGDGTFAVVTTTPAGGNALQNAALGDFNGDGLPDLAGVNSGDNSLGVLLGQLAQATAADATSVALVGTGTHQIEARYSGDSNYGPSVSAATGLTAQPVLTSTITFAVGDHTYGDAPFSISATSNSTGTFTYSVVSGPATISGSTVTLTGAGTVVLQASLAATGNYGAAKQTTSITVQRAQLAIAVNDVARVFGAANPTFTTMMTGQVNQDTFAVTFTTTATAASIVGTYPIVPSVTGANLGSYELAASPGTLTISQAGTATTFALSNQNLTLTATVVSLISGVPTGAVRFYEGQVLVGTGTLSNGVANSMTSTLPTGDVVVTAQYSGDANFTQSASPSIPVLSVASAANSLTVVQAGSVTGIINLSAAAGYVGTVQMSCGGLPRSATCSFEPSSIAFTGSNNSGSSTVMIRTGVSAQASFTPSPSNGESRSALLAAMVWMPALLVTLGSAKRKNRSLIDKLLLITLLCVAATTFTACGGSSVPNSSPTGLTPTGAYTVQVLASGPNGLSQTTSLKLTVQ